jgi:hypothetical protein
MTPLINKFETHTNMAIYNSNNSLSTEPDITLRLPGYYYIEK